MIELESPQKAGEAPTLIAETETKTGILLTAAEGPNESQENGHSPPPDLIVSDTPTQEVETVLTTGKNKQNQKPRKPKSRSGNEKRIPIERIIESLTDPETGQFPNGVSPKQLLQYTEGLPVDKRPNTSKNHLQVQLSRKAAKGTIIRLQAGGLYTTPDVLKKKSNITPKENDKTSEDSLSDRSMSPIFAGVLENSRDMSLVKTDGVTTDSSLNASALTSPKAGKRKSDESRPKRKRTKKEMGPDFFTYESDNKQQGAVCEICLLPKTNARAEPDNLLTCKDCGSKAHPGCLGFSRQLALSCRKQPWQCYQCKVCAVCASADDAENLLLCDGCDKAFHMSCMQPAITEKPPGKWFCDPCNKHKVEVAVKRKCRTKLSTRQRTVESCLAKQTNRLAADHVIEFGINSSFPTCDCEASSVLPDLTSEDLIKEGAKLAESWTAEQAGHFISAIGFDSVANVFMEQEIDGQALLLLKRNDVLSRLSLKLGPALKLYRRIFALQAVFEKLSSPDCDDS